MNERNVMKTETEWKRNVKRLKANDPSLTTLKLVDYSIGDDGAKAIAKALKVNTVLTELDLDDNSIGDDGAKAIAEALKVNTVLTELSLRDNSIGVDGAKAIADALKDNTVLTELGLVDNSIGDDGAKAIAEDLKDNTVLTTLYLYNNSIGADGAKAIAEALKVNTVLTILYLGSNSIGVDGAKAIAEALKVNTVLTELDLDDNSIGDDGAKAIAEALKVNTVLTNLSLSNNSIGVDGAKAIAEALKVNTVLTTLGLSNNSIGDSLLDKIQRTVEISKDFLKPENIDDIVFKYYRDLAAALIWGKTALTRVDDIEAQMKACPEAAKVQDRHGNTLLHHGIELGADVVVIKVLLDACPDVMMMKDNKGNTPLHLGMKVRAPVECINALLEACPQAVTIKANNGETPLDCGLGGEKRVSLESIQAFVDKCPDAKKMPFIPLHLAIFRGGKAPEIEQIITKYPNSVANYGSPNLQSPLLLALQQGDYSDFEVVCILIEKHPDATNTLDNETGYNPFTYCVSRLLQSIKNYATLDLGDDQSSFQQYKLKEKLWSLIKIWYKTLRLLCASLNDVGDLKQLCMLDTPRAKKVSDGLGFFFGVLATNEFNPFNRNRTLPCLDLNHKPITNWTVLEILVDLGTDDAANIFFQIEEQLRGSEEQDQLEISINNHIAKKVASFQSIAQVKKETWQKVADRAKLSKLDKLKEWGDKYGRFLGKYLIQEEKHLSDTCVVYFGTEFNFKSENTKETNVALKFFTDSSAFLRELDKRYKIRSKVSATQFVINVRAAYSDSKKGLDASDYPHVEFDSNQTIEWKRGDLKIEWEKGYIEFNHLLVMDCGNKNDLSDVISRQNIASKDVHAVRSIAIQIAKCLKFLNETCEVIHGDVKARNFVSRGEGVGYAAIDLDNAALIGLEDAVQKRTSSGYLPPEQAAVEYHLRIGQVATKRVKASPQYDMWCFGVLLYYLCTGEQLFHMNIREEVSSPDELRKIVNWSDEDCVQKLNTYVRDNNDWNPMKPLLKKLLKRDPEERHRCWADIISKLQDVGNPDIHHLIEANIQKMQVQPIEASTLETSLMVLQNLAEIDNQDEIAGRGGIFAILPAMKTHLTNANVQYHGCALLFNLAVNNENIKMMIAAAGGITTILDAMMAHSDRADVQHYGSAALWNLAVNNDINRVAIADAGGIATILSAMKTHPSNADVQQNGCATLWNLAVNNDKNRVAIAKAEGITTILAAMTTHPSRADVQNYGCAALWKLAENDNNQVVIHDEGGTQLILSRMRNHPYNANIQHYGCAALQNLAMNEKSKTTIAEAGGITTILSAMKTHSPIDDVQEYGCGALSNLAVNHDKNRVTIAQKGGITMILSAMKTHSSNFYVQKACCGTIFVLSYNTDENKVMNTDAECIAMILIAMKTHLSKAEVQEAGCRALFVLSYNNDNNNNKVTIAKAEGITTILSAMKTHSFNSKVQYLCIAALSNLADKNENNKVMIAAAGGISTIVFVMNNHSSNAYVQHYGCAALSNLADNNENNQVMIAAAGGISTIVFVMNNHSSNAYVQHYGCAALSNLADNNENNQVMIAAAGGISTIVFVMNNHSSNAYVQQYGCAALQNLACKNDNNLSRISNAGGKLAIESAIQNHPSNADVQKKGHSALLILTQHEK